MTVLYIYFFKLHLAYIQHNEDASLGKKSVQIFPEYFSFNKIYIYVCVCVCVCTRACVLCV